MHLDKLKKYNGRYIDENISNYRRFLRPASKDDNVKTDLSQMTHGSYGGLLFDQRWKLKRSGILNRDNNKCVICNYDTNLQIHHRQYHYSEQTKNFKMPWDYDDHLLVTLCESCHKRGHSKYKVPIINVQ